MIRRKQERGAKETVIFDYSSRLHVCPKAKDCRPANHGGGSVCVSVSVQYVIVKAKCTEKRTVEVAAVTR